MTALPPDGTIVQGDALEVLRGWPSGSVQCCITSPPYWGLRDYGLDPWIGGDLACDHKPSTTPGKRGIATSTIDGGKHTTGHQQEGYKIDCPRCSAVRAGQQIGLEATPDEHVTRLVEVFREVRRVLRDDGVLFLNYGDAYAGSGNGGNPEGSKWAGFVGNQARESQAKGKGALQTNLKPKDLIGLPWMVAFALRADGWWLRTDIVWAKGVSFCPTWAGSVMPESVRDRPTRSHEYLFLLAKGQWKRRAVKLADLGSEPLHLGRSLSGSDPDTWAARISICLASAILDSPQVKQKLSSVALQTEIGQQNTGCISGLPIRDLPTIERVATYATRLLNADTSPKEFLTEIHSLGLVMGQGDAFLVAGGNLEITHAPLIHAYGERSIAIHDASKIGEFNFQHGEIIAHSATICKYFYDSEAVREEMSQATIDRRGWEGSAGWDHEEKRTNPPADVKNINWLKTALHQGRNLRSVWVINPQPYPGAHFATFPEALVEPCIRAGTSERGACPACGAPWVRVVEASGGLLAQEGRTIPSGTLVGGFSKAGMDRRSETEYARHTTGWRAGCDCTSTPQPHSPHGEGGEQPQPQPPAPRPCIVLDPFAGSGTTGMVAARLGCAFVGIDLAGGDKDLGGHTAHDRIRGAREGRTTEEAAGARKHGQTDLLELQAKETG